MNANGYWHNGMPVNLLHDELFTYPEVMVGVVIEHDKCKRLI